MQNDILVESVYKAYGKVQALKGVSLKAEAGKILGLLGPNGAGKTTLVRILTTLLKPDSGTVKVAGIDVVHNPGRVREMIGLAGQYPAVDEQLTGRENLVMVGQLYHLGYRYAKDRAAELLDRFFLADAADRPVKTYSGGMRRRLDLAASIVAKPSVQFLDEPTTGLDPRTRMEMWATIRELVADGTTLLLTTQYLEEADELADYVVVMDVGKVIAEGKPEELKAKLGREMLQVRVTHLSDLPKVTSILERIGNDKPHFDDSTGEISVVAPAGIQSLLDAIRALDSEHIAIADISLRRPTLDEVFLSITGQNNN